MFKRQTVGSVVCPSCGSLVGVNDDRCYNCGRRNPGLWGYGPLVRRLGRDLGFVPLVIGGCSLLYVITLLVSGPSSWGVYGPMNIFPPSSYILEAFGASGAGPVFGRNQWWTILSANWLHGSLLHILFNMIWVRQLVPPVADMYGVGRTIIIYTIAGAAGFFLSSVAGYFGLQNASITIGASAAIFGLLGALVHYGRRSVSSAVTSQALTYAVILFVFGLMMPGVDNFAHAGGFAGGYIASAWLNPLTAERQEHLIVALACIMATILSILASVVVNYQYIVQWITLRF